MAHLQPLSASQKGKSFQAFVLHDFSDPLQSVEVVELSVMPTSLLNVTTKIVYNHVVAFARFRAKAPGAGEFPS